MIRSGEVIMSDSSNETPGTEYVQLAFGACGAWEVAVNEAVDDQCNLIISLESTNVYLHFKLVSLSIVNEICRMLEADGQDNCCRIVIGTFGSGKVDMVRDDEYRDRFFVRCLSAESVFHLQVSGEDVVQLKKCFLQVVDDFLDDR
jgi:hypothetical protein